MVRNRKKHTPKTPAKQGADPVIPKPMKIGASTPYDFQGSNLTPYGGLLPVATMLEKLQFQELIERHVTITRLTTSMPGYRFVLAMILALYVGFSRLNHLPFLEREPMAHRNFGGDGITGADHVLAILGVAAPGGSAATAGGGPADATTGLGGGLRRIERSHPRHRHDSANGVRPADGSTQGVQPEAPREEELSADLNFFWPKRGST